MIPTLVPRLAILVALLLPSSPLLAQSALEPEPRLGAEHSVFDGATLEGWVVTGGRYDGNARWSVEEGAIVGRQGPNKAGGLIYTERRHRNAVVSFETRIDWPFDSGVFLRMAPRAAGKGAQVTLDWREGGEIGGIYADGWLHHQPAGKEAFRKDEWNRVTVRFLGDPMRVTFWLNGALVTDYTLPTGDGYAPTGLIGLQVHGGEAVPDAQAARFRDIRVLELPEFDPALFSCDSRGLLTPTEEGRALGWRPLFDGRSLEGWQPVGTKAEDYLVRDGQLVFPKSGGDGYLRTRELFRDFELRLDFKIAYMCNSGLFLRGDPKGGNPAFSGCEIQILDDFNWERVAGYELKPYQFTGGLYGSVAPGVASAMRPLGSWNTYEVRYVGSRIAVRLNGHLLYDVDTFEVPADKPFRERATTGFLALQRHAPEQAEGDYAWFRNVLLRPIEIAEDGGETR